MAFNFSCMLGAGLSLLVLSACDTRVSPQREWRPEDHGQPAQADPSRVATEQAAPEAGGVDRAAAALWTVSCASCHGRDGRGLGEGRPPGSQMPDFTSAEYQKQRSDADLVTVIQQGRGMMPAFGEQMNEQGIRALIGHIRRFGTPSP